MCRSNFSASGCIPVGCERPTCGNIAASMTIAASSQKARLQKYPRSTVVPLSFNRFKIFLT
jgi:hypothetical protein